MSKNLCIIYNTFLSCKQFWLDYASILVIVIKLELNVVICELK